MTSQQVSIAILGGGPGGLTLARILQLNGIKCTVYERDASSDVRGQGGTLDLHPESGQIAIIKANLWDQVESLLRYEGQDTRIMDKAGNILYDSQEATRDRPEIDRGDLRKLLLNSLEKDTVIWDHALQSISQNNDKKYKLEFQNGSSAVYDFVVGADGAWSKVRSIICDEKPAYSGISMVELRISDIKSRFPHTGKLIGDGSLMALAPERGMIAQQNGDGSARNYMTLHAPEDWIKTCGIDFTSPQNARKALVELFHDWGDELLDFVRNCDDEITPRALYQLPVGFRWQHRPGVTVVGDAAHLMTPFAGEGVNLAMLDAKELAEAIIQNPGDLDESVKNFEEKMFARAKEAAEGTQRNMQIMFAQDAPHGIVSFFQSLGPPQ